MRDMAVLSECPGPMAGVRTFVVHCIHGTTQGHVVNASDTRLVLDCIEILVSRHEQEERCGCTRSLRPLMPTVPV